MTRPEKAKRLEDLWRGEFGDEYSRRNIEAEKGRGPFWRDLLEKLRPKSVLEVGSNVGGNLRWIAASLSDRPVVGLDVNFGALRTLRERVDGADAVLGAARHLPFRDASFGLVFTMGVLIHQPPETLDAVMAEVVRCSSEFVVCGEYFADEPTEVAYRGVESALFKRDFGGLYMKCFPALQLVDYGFLAKGEGTWDDVTWWVLRKR